MTRSATGSWKCASALTLIALAAASPLAAQEQPEQDKPEVVGGDPDVREIATTPLRDLNLSRDEIPALLQQAAVAPYDSAGLGNCAAIGAAIADLDAVLGSDLDVEVDESDRISVGRIARSAVGSLLPFRSIVRELTGAADHQREFEQAILAGAVRRGYLKGLGEQRGCDYPARPAFAKVQVTKQDRVGDEEREIALARADVRTNDGVTFESRPVVQGE
jgi:hypothetical protein